MVFANWEFIFPVVIRNCFQLLGFILLNADYKNTGESAWETLKFFKKRLNIFFEIIIFNVCVAKNSFTLAFSSHIVSHLKFQY